jgi:wyosine [tRNA(Phe)-imidazoG37] synthetase (radical SAM superfamily)
MAVLREELDAMLALVSTGQIWQTPPLDATPPALRRLNDIAFSGNGEPTSSAAFFPSCQLAVELLAQYQLTGTKIVTITNATLLDRPAVQKAMAFLDAHNGEIWAKLDAGNEAMYQRIVRSSIPFRRVLDNILLAGRAREIVIQSMFLRFNDQEPTETEIADYARRLAELRDGGCRIRLVQAYTIARPVFESHIAPLPNASLDAIVSQVRALGIPAEAYYYAAPRANPANG